jgi:drug/metabolite transporter (DMT)-like permease
MPLSSILLMAALAAIWGASYLFIKLILADLGPLALNAARCLVGAVVLWAVVLYRRVPLPQSRQVWARLAFVGAVGIVVPFTAIAWGTQYIPSGMSAILAAVMPIFTYLIVLLVGEERLTGRRALGILVGFGGIVVLVLPELSGAGGRMALWGQLAIVGASISYAISITFARFRLQGAPSILIGTGQVTWALALFIPLALLEGLPARWPGLASLVALLVLGGLGTGVAYLIYYRLMRDIGVTATSLVSYLIPAVGVFWGWAVLRERLHWTAFVALALVVAGMVLVNSRPAAATQPAQARLAQES